MLTEEQVQFAQMLDRFVGQEYGGASGSHVCDRARFARAAEMGCLSLAVPEEHGGFGGPVEVMLMMQHLAPALPKEPILCSGIYAAALLVAALPGETAAKLLPSLTDGSVIATPALMEDGGRYRLDHVSTIARPNGDGWTIDGAKHLVEFAMEADILIVSARHEQSGKLGLYRVDATCEGLRKVSRPRVDGIACANLRLDNCQVPASALIAETGVEAMIETARDRAEAAQVAEMVGLMDALIRETIGYVQTRRQFGSEIGRFQALQHRIADMWIACEEARSLALAAAFFCDASDQERRKAVSTAKFHACDAARLIAAEAVQMHGGIGVTDELIVGHWFKRLLALRASLGDRRFHKTRLVALASSSI